MEADRSDRRGTHYKQKFLSHGDFRISPVR
jgi:hypothetical protein